MHDNQGSYTPDMAAMIDTQEEIIADELGVSLTTASQIVELIEREAKTRQAMSFGQFIGLVLKSENQPAVIYAFALAAGLDQLNGIKSETEVAERLGCTRALISHYVIAARDLLSGDSNGFDILKFRKRNETRATYATNSTSSFKQAKMRAIKRINQQ